MPIWKREEFWAVITDIVVSGATTIGGLYLVPDHMQIVGWAVTGYQMVTGLLCLHFMDKRAEARIKELMGTVQQVLRQTQSQR